MATISHASIFLVVVSVVISIDVLRGVVGRFLASASIDESIRVWDTVKRTCALEVSLAEAEGLASEWAWAVKWIPLPGALDPATQPIDSTDACKCPAGAHRLLLGTRDQLALIEFNYQPGSDQPHPGSDQSLEPSYKILDVHLNSEDDGAHPFARNCLLDYDPNMRLVVYSNQGGGKIFGLHITE